jgi:uncharacterized membrane protein YdjX (TVP38/TMEM64 family)
MPIESPSEASQLPIAAAIARVPHSKEKAPSIIPGLKLTPVGPTVAELLRKAKIHRTKLAVGLVVVLVFVLIVILILSRNLDNIRAFLLSSGQIGLVFSVLLYGLLGASPIPSEPLTVLLSALYGPLNITIVATLGNLLSALVEYYIGVKIGNASDFEKRRQKLPFGLGKFPADSVPFLILARFLPGYGAKFISVFSGIMHVRVWRYVWTTVLSTLIGAAIVAYGGFGLLNLFK